MRDLMALTEKFLVNTENFDAIIEKIRTTEDLPEQIDKTYLESLGYENPPDFLILTLMKELRLLSQDYTPTPLFDKFRDKETSKEALAIGLLQAYGDLYEKFPSIHTASAEDTANNLRECFESPKSEIILKYMAQTFKTLVNYIGQDKLNAVLEQKASEVSNIENIVKEIAQKHQNGEADVQNADVLTIPGVNNSEQDDPEKEIVKKESDQSIISETSEEVDSPEEENETENINEPSDQERSDDKYEEQEGEEMDIEEHHSNGHSPEQYPEDDPFGINKSVNSNPDTMQAAVTNSTHQSRYIDKALIKKAALLYKVGRLNEALPALDKVFDRFSTSDSSELYNHASIALINKMKIVEKLELQDELLPVYTKIINRLEDSDNSDFNKYVDHAYVKKVDTLLDNNELEEGLDAIKQAINHFKESDAKSQFLEKAMYKRAEILEKLGRDEDALDAYEELLIAFDN